MHKLAYTQALTPQERASCIKAGMQLCLAANGISDEQALVMHKKGQFVSGVGAGVEGVAKTILAVSVLTGVPLGIAAHMIGRQVSAKRRSESEQIKRIGYYRNATKQLESGLATRELKSQ